MKYDKKGYPKEFYDQYNGSDVSLERTENLTDCDFMVWSLTVVRGL